MFGGLAQGIADMFNDDKFPAAGSGLYNRLCQNPNLLRSELPGLTCKDSLIAALLDEGCLRCVEKISQLDSADIFYCGELSVGLESLCFSAGVNVYLALKNLQQPLEGEQNYYQRLYWKNPNQAMRRTSITYVDVAYSQYIVPWFVERAGEIDQIKASLNRGDDDQLAHITLAKRYFTIAVMEDSKNLAGQYFMLKAVEHLMQAFPLSSRDSLEGSLESSLKEVSHESAAKSLEVWREAYRVAERYSAEIFERYYNASTMLEPAIVTSEEGVRRRHSVASSCVAGYAASVDTFNGGASAPTYLGKF